MNFYFDASMLGPSPSAPVCASICYGIRAVFHVSWSEPFLASRGYTSRFLYMYIYIYVYFFPGASCWGLPYSSVTLGLSFCTPRLGPSSAFSRYGLSATPLGRV